MKTRRFSWGWEDYPPQKDDAMTTERAVRLFRAWRRATTNHSGPLFTIRKLGTHTYRITHTLSGERSVIAWENA